MTTTIQKWGNSQGIRIPKVILDTVDLKENDSVNIVIDNNKLVIEKANSKRKNIKELFKNYKGKYKPVDIDWGKPERKEIW